MHKGEFIGINFGTTNTAVVRMLNYEEGCSVTNLGEGGGKYPFSSVVAIHKNGGEPKIGREVRESREELSSDYEIFTSMKSYLGTDKEFIVGSNRYSATDITAGFFKYIKDYIAKLHKIEITEAGLSFPVSFTPEARRELCAAAERAGITVKSFISESTAAYFANRKESRAYSRVMVLDWGGGTFDISILNLKKNSVSEIAVYGEEIGGDNIDMELAKCVHAEIVKKSALDTHMSFDEMNPKCRDTMINRCEKAKIEISNSGEECDFTIFDYGEYGTKSITISVDMFNGIVEPIIKSRILRAINSALSRANLTPAGIDAVIIVGGSSNLTPYETAITKIFGEDKIILSKEPQWSTAEGAALMQIIGGSFKLNDTLGILMSDDTVFPLFEAKYDGVGTKIKPINFSLVADVQDAHFVFTSSDAEGRYTPIKRASVQTKGFLNELIKVTAEINDDQIAVIEIHNTSMGNASKPSKKVEINKLTFYYDMSELEF